MKYEDTEKEIKNITVHDKGCINCKKFKKDIMISYTSTQNDEIIDLFLTNEQTHRLIINLQNNLEYNKINK